MPELHDLLERRAADYAPPEDLLARVRERGRRRQRNRRMGTALTAVVMVALTAGGLSRLLPPSNTVLFEQPPEPFVGTWVSIDGDGSRQTMDIRALGNAAYDVVVADDGASVCSGAPSTMTGTGQVVSAGLVVAAPTLECDDGSTPVALDGSSLEEALRDYTLVYDAARDTLTDSFEIQWRRSGAIPDPDSTKVPAPRPLWPQSSIEEVREAQERADAGDLAYTWQVEPAMGDVGGDAEIFTRFLTDELGWEGFRWGAEANHAESMHWGGAAGSSSVDFVRCAPGEMNPMYPNDPEGRGCAPALDERAYETVRVTAYQPLRVGPDGIWVIQSSEPQPPFRQVVPLSEAEIARPIEWFLQARVDGDEDLRVDTSPAKIPLLYSTSDGARYDRFEYEVVEGPTWPFGAVLPNVRLFADGGAIVVEQPFRLELDFFTVVQPQPTQRMVMLEYDPRRSPTTENGVPVPEPYSLFGGRVTFSADRSWEDAFFGPHGPDVIGLYRSNEHDQLFAVVGDPLTPTGTCDIGDRPPSADALVRSIRSRPNLSVSVPRPTRVGSFDAVQLDVNAADQGEGCVIPPDADQQPAGSAVLAPRADRNHPDQRLWWGVARHSRARLYVFDVPGNPTRTVAILIMAPQSAFERVLTAAEAVIESFELETDR